MHSGKPARPDCAYRNPVYHRAMAQKNNSDIGQMPFERAIEELESIVKRLEEGKVPLEESVTIYERGEALKRRCEDLLRQAEARVEKITLDAAGKPTGSEPLDVE
jgi:exodeoxyribonuclease VII small subunit